MHFTLSFFSLCALAVVVSAANVQLENTNGPFPACLSASSKTIGADVVVQDCSTGDASNHNWVVNSPSGPTPQQIMLSGTNLCLDVRDGINADGTRLQLWTCTNGNTNQLFSQTSSQGTWQWAGTNKCIDLTNGAFTNNNPMQVWTCDAGNTNQRFTANPVTGAQNPAVMLHGGSNFAQPQLCLTATENRDGAPVTLARCDNVSSDFASGDATWIIPSSGTEGHLSTFNGAKCLDLPQGDATNGNLLQIWTCVDGNTNQNFRVENEKIMRIGNKCLDIQNGNYVAGANIQIFDCFANNVNQRFVPMQQ